jgi:hypothetical protein
MLRREANQYYSLRQQQCKGGLIGEDEVARDKEEIDDCLE